MGAIWLCVRVRGGFKHGDEMLRKKCAESAPMARGVVIKKHNTYGGQRGAQKSVRRLGPRAGSDAHPAAAAAAPGRPLRLHKDSTAPLAHGCASPWQPALYTTALCTASGGDALTLYATAACGSCSAPPAAAAAWGHRSTRWRSPYTLSTREVVGQNLASFRYGSG